MQGYEYRVVPAPNRGRKARGAKTTPERFALALTETMNAQAADGWEFVRADTLPCEERAGLTGRTTVQVSVLVFRRALDAERALPILDETTVPPALRAPAGVADLADEPATPVAAPPPPADPMSAEGLGRSLVADAPEGRAPKITPFRRDRAPEGDS
ncbi:MAG: DUF4177 domain-containing protein [Rhodobacteraceae bacterium]|nr:DUF4177 domain-containing protein [Paracoccaceae bacterium]